MLKFVVLVVVVGVLVYLAVRVIDRRLTAPSRTLSPDDDPDFLRDLDQQRWEQRPRRERGDAGGPQADDDSRGP